MRRRRSKFIEPSLPHLGLRHSPPSFSRTGSLTHTCSGKPSIFHAYSGSFDSPHKVKHEARKSVFQFPSAVQLSTNLAFEFSPAQTSPLLPGQKQSYQRQKRPTRFVLNCVSRCVYKSRPGNAEERPHNQDAFLIQPKLQGLRSQYVFGVFDGHGTYGREVSHYLKSAAATHIEKHLTADDLVTSLRRGVSSAVGAFHRSRIECAYSGSTLNLVLIRDNQLLCANIGDSCSVLGRKIGSQWKTVELSTAHTLWVAAEKARVLQAGGRVKPYRDAAGADLGSERVWVHGRLGPGLAISRSVGDTVAHSVGVSDEPEVTQITLTAADKFVLLATDGLWQLLSRTEAVAIVGAAIDRGQSDQAVSLLFEAAHLNRPDGHVDDTTVIIIYLNSDKLCRATGFFSPN